jgi:hypothetical protein
MAVTVGITSQSLSQAEERKLISLPFLLIAHKHANELLDYLIYEPEHEFGKVIMLTPKVVI